MEYTYVSLLIWFFINFILLYLWSTAYKVYSMCIIFFLVCFVSLLNVNYIESLDFFFGFGVKNWKLKLLLQCDSFYSEIKKKEHRERQRAKRSTQHAIVFIEIDEKQNCCCCCLFHVLDFSLLNIVSKKHVGWYKMHIIMFGQVNLW